MAEFTEFLDGMALPKEIFLRMQRLQKTQHLSRAEMRQSQRQAGQELVAALLLQLPSMLVVTAITHTADTVFAAVASKEHFSHLGLDSEGLIDTARADRLAKRILTSAERAQWPKTNLPWPEFVTLVFCLKEAAYKSLTKAEQKGLGFQNFSVRFAGSDLKNPISVVISPSNHANSTQLSGNFILLTKQVLCAVWREV